MEKTWNITMESGGGTTCVFMGGFSTEQEAIEIAEQYDWKFVDENGFEWSLEIEEED